MVNWKRTLLSAAGGQGGGYWLVTYDGNNGSLPYVTSQGYGGLAVDSDNNIYTAADSFASSPTGGRILFRTDTDGNNSYVKYLNQAGGTLEFRGIVVDSSDNLYIGGQTTYDAVGSLDAIIAKLNRSTGAEVWSRQSAQSNVGNYAKNGRNLVIDSNGSCCLAGQVSQSGNTSFGAYAIDSSGAFRLHKALYVGSTQPAQTIAVLSNDDFVIGGYDSVSGYNRGKIVHYNNALTSSTWQATQYINNVASQVTDLSVDSSNNIYAAGWSYNGSATAMGWVLKRPNSGGNANWTYAWSVLGGSNNQVIVKACKYYDGYLYYIGDAYTTSGGSTEAAIFGRIDASTGSPDYQYTLEAEGSYQTKGEGITIDNNGDLILCGQKRQSSSFYTAGAFVAKLPADGSVTGTFGNVDISTMSVNSTDTLISAQRGTASANVGSASTTRAISAQNFTLAQHNIQTL